MHEFLEGDEEHREVRDRKEIKKRRNMQINYSFIIPHKNCPDLLQRCVDSIPERDDVQVIVVDDNSDEGKKNYLIGMYSFNKMRNREMYVK